MWFILCVQGLDWWIRDVDHVGDVVEDVLKVHLRVGVEDQLLATIPLHVADDSQYTRTA